MALGARHLPPEIVVVWHFLSREKLSLQLQELWRIASPQRIHTRTFNGAPTSNIVGGAKQGTLSDSRRF